MSGVPELLQKKKERDERIAGVQVAALKAKKAAKKVSRKELVTKAAAYAEGYATAERADIDARRAARAEGNFFVPQGPKVIYATRIRGINGVDPKTRKILQLLRLRQLHNGVFIKVNYATQRMLQRVEPYVTYGYPNLKSVRELIYKRGFGKVGKAGAWSRIPLSDNSVVEKQLGKLGIVSVEDLIHEIYTCGPHFKEASNFLWPFKTSSPKGGYSRFSKLKHFTEGGEHGNRDRLINNLIRRMN